MKNIKNDTKDDTKQEVRRFTPIVAKGTEIDEKGVNIGYEKLMNIKITLEEDEKSLDTLVVKVLGIKKEAKALVYSLTKVGGDDLAEVKTTSAINSLQGRVAGLQINRTFGSSGGGMDILIRGVTSVNPERNNQPLIIVDGIALNNDTFSGSVLPSAGTNSPSSSEQLVFQTEQVI